MTKGSSLILRLYFAVVSAVTLFTLMFGAIDFLSIGLKSYIFTAADVPEYLESCSTGATYDSRYAPKPVTEAGTTVPEVSAEQLLKECEARNQSSIETYKRTKASQAVRNLALIIISTPLFLLHFRIVHRDWVEDRKNTT